MAFGIKWLKPELDEPIYYVHIAIIIGVIYLLMNWKNPGTQLWLWGLYLIAADGTAHSILGLD